MRTHPARRGGIFKGPCVRSFGFCVDAGHFDHPQNEQKKKKKDFKQGNPRNVFTLGLRGDILQRLPLHVFSG
jgi:hypothetical protein